MLVAVVVSGRYHEPDERFGSHRREVRVVVKGEGGQLMNGGGDCRTPNYSDRTVFFCLLFNARTFLRSAFTIYSNYDNTNLLSLSSTVIDSTHCPFVYIGISTFHQ